MTVFVVTSTLTLFADLIFSVDVVFTSEKDAQAWVDRRMSELGDLEYIEYQIHQKEVTQ